MFVTLLLTALYGGLVAALKPNYAQRFVGFVFSALFLGLIGSCVVTLSSEKYRADISVLTDRVVALYCVTAILITTIAIIANHRKERATDLRIAQEHDLYPVAALNVQPRSNEGSVPDHYRLADPVAWTVTINEINAQALKKFQRSCAAALEDKVPRVCIEINTNGGFEREAYAMVDIIRELDQSIDVYIRVLGKCESAGNIILMAVSRAQRIASCSSQFMLHAGSGGTKQLNDISNLKMARFISTGTFLSEAGLTTLFNSRQNCYLTADEALVRGLIGAIR